MTNLNQFNFLTYYSSYFMREIFYPEVFDKNHNFNKIVNKYSDNSAALIECCNCKLKAVIYKISHDEFKIEVRDFSSLSKAKFSCNEILIKTLLE